MVRVMPLFLIPLAVTVAPRLLVPLPLSLALHLACFFAVGMVCHGELARRRPPAAQLTEFYFFLSVGGVLGGAFNALLAPLIFPDVWEYPLELIAACLLRPTTQSDTRHGLAWDVVLPLILLGLLLAARAVLPAATTGSRLPWPMAVFGYILPALAVLNFPRDA